MKNKPFYITTTLPYTNSDPHLGFAMEIIRADIIARYNRALGREVFFNTGTDEHGIKIYQAAEKAGLDVKSYVDMQSAKVRSLKEQLNLSFDNFIRTTDEQHISAATEFWKISAQNGDIYKKNYKSKYCVGCEMERTDSELVNGRCELHQDRDLEIIEEENYFFRYSKYQDKLIELYEKWPNFVLPQSRLNEIKAFVSRGLQDFSISRLKSKLPWGIPVPGDPDHVMYVWFDALVSYIATIGWQGGGESGTSSPSFKKWVIESDGMVQYCGKDNLRPQAAMWQAMMMSVGISSPERPATRHIIVDGFINSGGQKMSKSLGNVISPLDVTTEYGIDALRYMVAREFSPFEDTDVTMDRLREAYNSGLANGLGNLVSRVIQMAITSECLGESAISGEGKSRDFDYDKFAHHMQGFDIQSACNMVWQHIQKLDLFIQSEQPFKKVKVDKDAAVKDIKYLVGEVVALATLLEPVLPATSKEIILAVKEGRKPVLFPRK